MESSRSFFVFLLLTILVNSASGQLDTLYQEHFTDGIATLNWFAPWQQTPSLLVLAVPGNPSGDGWVGVVNKGESGVGTALAGTISMTDYEVQAWVYCTVSASAGGAYHAICARWDTAGSNKYYYLRTDFDTDQRLQLRFYDGSMAGVTIATWTGSQIPGGVPTSNSWHRMALKCQGNQLWAWWDDNLLSGSPYTNDSLSHGFFGAYVFRMTGTASTIFDDMIILAPGTLSPFDVTLTPINPPIVVPANGGSFNFTASVIRSVGPPAPFVVWGRIKNPNGTYTLPTLGPVTINPPVGVMVSRVRTQTVPGTWSSGIYTYLGYGNLTYSYPAADSSSFTFTKSATADGNPWVSQALCGGEPFPGEIPGEDLSPSSFVLNQAAPNPFNASTVIRYQLFKNGLVSLKVYDLTGRLVATLVDGWQDEGLHELTFNGSNLAAGIYFTRLNSGGVGDTQKLVLLK